MRETMAGLRSRLRELEQELTVCEENNDNLDDHAVRQAKYIGECNERLASQEQAILQKEDRIAQLARDLLIRDARIEDLEAEVGCIRLWNNYYYDISDHYKWHRRRHVCVPVWRIWHWLKRELRGR